MLQSESEQARSLVVMSSKRQCTEEHKQQHASADSTDPDPEAEAAAEASLLHAKTLASAASSAEHITGLAFGPGAPTAPLYFEVRPDAANRPGQYARPAGERLVLTYFAIRGLGEVCRLVLAEVQAAYDEVSVIGGERQADVLEWRANSPNGLLPTVSGLGLPRSEPASQSGAVLRFMAEKYGLHGHGTDDGGGGGVARVRSDTLFETARDLKAHKKEVIGPRDAAAEEEMKPKGPWALAKRIEAMLALAPRAEDPASALSLGQLELLHCLLTFEEAGGEGTVARLGAGLEAFRAAAAARPGIRAYLASGHRFPATFGDLGVEGGYSFAAGAKARVEFKA